MAITRKKKREKVSLSDQKVRQFIEKGGDVQTGRATDDDKPKSLQLRLYPEQIAEIDEALSFYTGRRKMSRHAWILKAIEEKLQREHEEHAVPA